MSILLIFVCRNSVTSVFSNIYTMKDFHSNSNLSCSLSSLPFVCVCGGEYKRTQVVYTILVNSRHCLLLRKYEHGANINYLASTVYGCMCAGEIGFSLLQWGSQVCVLVCFLCSLYSVCVRDHKILSDTLIFYLYTSNIQV